MSLVYNSNKFQYAVSQSLPFGEVRRGFPFNAFNCMKAYSFDGQRFGYYGYDASGERTYKIDFGADFSKEGGIIRVNNLNIDNIMLYPNGYMNINQNGEYTKHYYADALRIASKIGSGFTADICDSANVINTAYSNYLNDRITYQSDIMVDELNEVVVPLQDIQNIDPMPYPNFCNLGPGGNETDLFFYHPDHLGSTGMVTDNNASVIQGLLYAPFGEIISDYNPTFHDSPMPNYAFNAKELDEENGMYYYSARYYAPPTFISRDPMFEKYPSISPYTYCANNPIILIDPNGEDWFENESTGEVYFNSEIGKDGAGTGNMKGDGWKWMGDNNMMGTVDNEFVNKYQSLAQEGGGTVSIFNAGNENGFHDGYEMNFGSNSEKFMNEMGFEKQMSEAYVHTKTIGWSYAEADLGRSTWSHSSEDYENVKYTYVKQGLNQSFNVKGEYNRSYKTGNSVFSTSHTFEIRSYQYNNKKQGNLMNNSTFQYFIQKAVTIFRQGYEAKH